MASSSNASQRVEEARALAAKDPSKAEGIYKDVLAQGYRTLASYGAPLGQLKDPICKLWVSLSLSPSHAPNSREFNPSCKNFPFPFHSAEQKITHEDKLPLPRSALPQAANPAKAMLNLLTGLGAGTRADAAN